MGPLPDVLSTPKRKELTRDQRLQVHTLTGIHWTPTRISRHLNITQTQVRYAQSHRLTPQKQRCGRKSLIDTPSRTRLAEYIRQSKATRRMRYCNIAYHLGLDCSEHAIRRALQKEGLFRRIARRKPPISEANRQARLRWAWEHVDWTREQWDTILWTDETWVMAGPHTRTWVTRTAGEEYDPTCVVEKIPRKLRWMFWGSFSGKTKGPGVFWEKDWGPIGSQTYCERIVPLSMAGYA